MTLFFFFLLPTVVYFLLGQRLISGFVSEPRRPLAVAICVFGCAVVPLGALVTLFFLGGQWPGSTEVAWTGLQGASDRSELTIGGDREDALVAWPNGSFAPVLSMAPASPKTVRLTARRGRGFIYAKSRSEEFGRWINGAVIPQGKMLRSGAFQLKHQRPAFPWPARTWLSIYDGQAREQAAIRIGLNREKVLSLATLVSPFVHELRAETLSSKNTAAGMRAQALEDWAAETRLLVTSEGELRLLRDADPPVWAELVLPVHVRVRWAGNQKIEADVESTVQDAGRVALRFSPPWRLSSPLPPARTDGAPGRRLTITGTPRPGDFAFVLPFGGQVSSERVDISITDRATQQPQTRNLVPDVAPAVQIEDTVEYQGVEAGNPVRFGSATLEVKVVHDLPIFGRTVLPLLLALGTLALGLVLTVPRMRLQDLFLLGGLLLVAWDLLALRVLLALRYVLDPRCLDSLSVSGVSRALTGLAVVPGLLLLVARLYRDRFESGWIRRSLQRTYAIVYLSGLLVLVGVITHLVPGLWPNLPTSLSPGLSLIDWTLLLLVYLFLLGHILCVYSPRTAGPLRRLFFNFEPLALLRKAATSWGWANWRRILTENRWKTLLTLLGLYALAALALGVVLLVFPGSQVKLLQELVVPFVLCWIPALIWLSVRLEHRPETPVTWRRLPKLRLLGYLLLFVALPLGALPIALGDYGSIFSLGAFYLMIAAVLLSGRPRHVGLLTLGVFALALTAAFSLYSRLDFLLESSLPGDRAKARMLAFREGEDVQRYLPFTTLNMISSDDMLTYSSLRGAIQQPWEMKAIAHRGGILGLGFGNAPVRRSQIGQVALQYDSTFSFFVLSEHGLCGGVSLLLLYAVPLGLVLWAGHRRFDIGFAVGVVGAGALLLEGLIHAAMNLEILPFNGRNLPLLSVNSGTDLIRWAFLFALIIQATLWRIRGGEHGFHPEAQSIVTPSGSVPTPVSGWTEWLFGKLSGFISLPLSPILAWSRRFWTAEDEDRRRYLHLCSWTTIAPLVLTVWIAVSGARLILDQSLDRPLTWTTTLQTMEQYLRKTQIEFDAQSRLLKTPGGYQGTGRMLFEQELARFNSLPDLEKVEQDKSAILLGISQVNSLEGFDAFMEQLRGRDNSWDTGRRPSMYMVEPPSRWVDAGGEIPNVDPVWTIVPNPEYNSVTSFAAQGPGSTRVSLRTGSQGSWSVSGRDFNFEVANKQPTSRTDRMVLEITDSRLRKVPGQAEMSQGRVELRLRIRPTGTKPRKKAVPPRDKPLGLFEAVSEGLQFRSDAKGLKYRIDGTTGPREIAPGESAILMAGDRISCADAIATGLKPVFQVGWTPRGLLIGPAWINGSYSTVHAADDTIPWVGSLANALALTEQPSSWLKTLSIDGNWQQISQAFTAEKGRTLHEQNLRESHTFAPGTLNPVNILGDERWREKLPPRTALAVIDLPSGEVRALGGWPRTTTGEHWEKTSGAGLIPPARWLEREAPTSLRRIYAGERNFDPMVLGSATKPLWASAVLQVHPNLARGFRTRGRSDFENSVFGIRICSENSAWHAYPDWSWCDFTRFLSKSDNRYEVLFGFAGLANEPGSELRAGEQSQSEQESIDGGKRVWGHAPEFPASLQFGSLKPGSIAALADTKLAEEISALYGVAVSEKQLRRQRLSLWTKDVADDWLKQAEEAEPEPGSDSATPGASVLRFLSPGTTRLDLDKISQSRLFVTLLLGGGTNLWANVDLAGAFGTCVTGRPVLPHVTVDERPITLGTRASFPDTARLLRPGLQAVITGGTATSAFRATKALQFVQSLSARGVKAYAKTGTLAQRKGSNFETSRIMLALVRWKNESKGEVDHGLVFSLVVENAREGMASRWMGEFLDRHREEIEQALFADVS